MQISIYNLRARGAAWAAPPPHTFSNKIFLDFKPGASLLDLMQRSVSKVDATCGSFTDLTPQTNPSFAGLVGLGCLAGLAGAIPDSSRLILAALSSKY